MGIAKFAPNPKRSMSTGCRPNVGQLHGCFAIKSLVNSEQKHDHLLTYSGLIILELLDCFLNLIWLLLEPVWDNKSTNESLIFWECLETTRSRNPTHFQGCCRSLRYEVYACGGPGRGGRCFGPCRAPGRNSLDGRGITWVRIGIFLNKEKGGTSLDCRYGLQHISDLWVTTVP